MKYILLPLLLAFALAFSQNLQISGGNDFSAVVCAQKTVNVSGANSSGQLGVDALGNPRGASSYSFSWLPVTMGTLGKVPTSTASIALPAIRLTDAGSGSHVLGLDCDSMVWAWGQNEDGQLGRGVNSTNHAQNSVPMRILKGKQVIAGGDADFLSKIVSISGGNNSSFAIEAGTGKVLSWGANDYGQLGRGVTPTNPANLPDYVMISPGVPLTGIIQIEGGDDCCYALDKNGKVWSWGVTFDGCYTQSNLGRDVTAQVNTLLTAPAACGAGATGPGVPKCIPFAGKVQKTVETAGVYDNKNPYTTVTLVDLDDIVSISGGDAHGLGLTSAGLVWSWGGDWAQGQLGQGGTKDAYTAQKTWAGMVLDVSQNAGTVVNHITKLALGEGVDGKAVYIAAGQASSAVVMANGKVVTFGARGLYNSGTTNIGSGSSISCPAGGDMILSGTFGDNSACSGTTCASKSLGTSYSFYPVKVKTATGADLTGMTQVSDGDAWYFAMNDDGTKAFAWGWNRRGELASGDFNDNCTAQALVLPSGCTIDYPCPGKPKLPANYSSCPIFSDVLDAQVLQAHTTYKYVWFYRATPGTGAWTVVDGTERVISGTSYTAPTGNNQTYTANQIGEYKVSLEDDRAAVAFLCGPCPILSDSVTISEVTNPYLSTGCWDATNNKGTFKITTPANSKIKWYSTQTSTTALNPSDSLPRITAAAAINTACGAGKHALFAEDTEVDRGALFPATTESGAKTVTQNPNLGTDNNVSGKKYATQVTVSKAITLEKVSFIAPNNITNASYQIVFFNNGSNNTIGTNYAITGGSVTVTTGSVNQVIEVPITVKLPVGVYWVSVLSSTNNNVVTLPQDFAISTVNNLFNTAFSDVANKAGKSYIKATSGVANGSNAKLGPVFNMKYYVGTGYTCNRILVCEDSAACTTPVDFVKFELEKNASSVEVSWVTAHEEETEYFTVMKSYDGINFVKTSTIKASRKTGGYNTYSIEDFVEGKFGIVYYKVIEHSKFGTITETNVKSVSLSTYNSTMSVVPNPSNGKFKISVGKEVDLLNVKILDLGGRMVFSETINSNSLEVDLSNTQKGLYFVYVNDGEQSWIDKVVFE